MGGSSVLVNLTVFSSNAGAQGGAIGMEGGGQLQVCYVGHCRLDVPVDSPLFLGGACIKPRSCYLIVRVYKLTDVCV